MKKIIPIILCIFFSLALSFILPHLGETWPIVDDTVCLKGGCHVADFSKGDLHDNDKHNDCTSQCHSGTPGGTVNSHKCLACHPENDSEQCDLVFYLEESPDYNPTSDSCLDCHTNCENLTTTTTTTLIFTCPVEKIYGKYSEETILLRNFRDNVLSQTVEGQELIKVYYQWSPVIVWAMEKDKKFKEGLKELIDGILPMIR